MGPSRTMRLFSELFTLPSLRAFLVCACMCSGPFCRAATEVKRTITWLDIGEAGSETAENADRRSLVDEATIKVFVAEIPEFSHSVIHVNLARALAMSKADDGYCMTGIAKSAEREQFLYFTKVTGWTLPHRIFALKAASGKFSSHLNDKGKMTLGSLLSDPGLKGAREAGGSFGAEVDSLFEHAQAKVQNLAHNGTAYKMLASLRFDWVIDDPVVAASLISHLPNAADFVSYDIAEEPPVQTNYAACSRGPIGKDAVDKINRSIEQAGPFPVWQQVYEDALDPVMRQELESLRASVPTR